MRIGIDVGGTNTDAVLHGRRRRVLAAVKRATTADVTGGIVAALDRPAGQHPLRRPAPDPGRDDRHDALHNAVVEATRLAPTAARPARAARHRGAAADGRLAGAAASRRSAASYLATAATSSTGGSSPPLDHDELRRHAGDIGAQRHPLGRDLVGLLAR